MLIFSFHLIFTYLFSADTDFSLWLVKSPSPTRTLKVIQVYIQNCRGGPQGWLPNAIASLACIFTSLSSNHLALCQQRLCDDLLELIDDDAKLTAHHVLYECLLFISLCLRRVVWLKGQQSCVVNGSSLCRNQLYGVMISISAKWTSTGHYMLHRRHACLAILEEFPLVEYQAFMMMSVLPVLKH